jgi:hypothetical protein
VLPFKSKGNKGILTQHDDMILPQCMSRLMGQSGREPTGRYLSTLEANRTSPSIIDTGAEQAARKVKAATAARPDQSMVGMVAGARWAVTNEDAPPKDNEGREAPGSCSRSLHVRGALSFLPIGDGPRPERRMPVTPYDASKH